MYVRGYYYYYFSCNDTGVENVFLPDEDGRMWSLGKVNRTNHQPSRQTKQENSYKNCKSQEVWRNKFNFMYNNIHIPPSPVEKVIKVSFICQPRTATLPFYLRFMYVRIIFISQLPRVVSLAGAATRKPQYSSQSEMSGRMSAARNRKECNTIRKNWMV